ncbi:3-oxoacyl-ACP reductase-like protein [Rhizobium sp. BK313]|jgi:hypothetical protein|uniref:DUF3597 domain-containing protein n=1 Tax=Rhizobium sp. BK313 TaxID=2587081 RepID=UPI00106167F3|nr:DUF3597 domain-containing protein [Rhizobium sp. BK313]MBB3453560.1 3-oxoacyl-ACP reductase-like protein [Rhizobium sp. BK313]
MGIFAKIKSAIWGEAKAAEVKPAATQTAAAGGAPTAAPAQAPSSSAGSAPTAGAQAAPAQAAPVDIASILDAAVKKSGQKLDWKHSIVDLMKALGMDASLAERKELAQELGYTGDAGDSAKMNMFLHKALMKKLSENGGKVPADLLD